MAKLKVTLSVDEQLRNRVAELAAVEERNFSQMWGVLVGEALAGREPVVRPSAPGGGTLEVEPLVFSEPLAAVALPVKRSRKEKCVHQIPVEAFCKWGCD